MPTSGEFGRCFAVSKYCPWNYDIPQDSDESSEESSSSQSDELEEGEEESSSQDSEEEGDEEHLESYGIGAGGAIVGMAGARGSLDTVRTELAARFVAQNVPVAEQRTALALFDWLAAHNWISPEEFQYVPCVGGKRYNGETLWSRLCHAMFDRSWAAWGGDLGVEELARAARLRPELHWGVRVVERSPGSFTFPDVRTMPRLAGARPFDNVYYRAESVSAIDNVPLVPIFAPAQEIVEVVAMRKLRDAMAKIF